MKKIIIVDPATSIGRFPKEAREVIKFLESKDLEVVLAPNTKLNLENKYSNEYSSSDAKLRAEDLTWAFEQNPDVILSFVGGYNSNEILEHLDWKKVKKSTAKFVGHSDITVLTNAIYAKTGKISYTGINALNFAVKESREETFKTLKNLLEDNLQELTALKSFQESFDAKLKKSSSWKFLNPETISGTLIGGNLDTIGLLQGTEYIPKFNKPTILVIEEDDLCGTDTLPMFKRSLISLFMQKGARKNIKAIICGRFPESSTGIDLEKISAMFKSLEFTKDLPILIGVEIDHCLPKTLLPIGQKVTILNSKQPEIKLQNVKLK